MVRRGRFSVELVDARTEEPLKEYDHNGECWVAGKPGQEFFLRLTKHQGAAGLGAYSGSQVAEGMPCIAGPIKVDGAAIGTSVVFARKAPESGIVGHIKAGDLNRKITFKFAALPYSDGGDGALERCGRVFVRFSTAINTGQPQVASTNGWSSRGEAKAPSSKKQGVGALKSTEGTTTKETTWMKELWVRGEELQNIEIRYCEEAQLAVRKILPANTVTAAHSSSGGKKPAAKPQGGGGKRAKTEAIITVGDDEDDDSAGPAEKNTPSATWSSEQVFSWLQGRGLAPTVLKNFKGLDGAELLALSKGNLEQDAGVPALKAAALFNLIHPLGSKSHAIVIE